MSIRSIINFKDALELVVGVSIKLLADGATESSYCVLKRNGDKISLFDKKDGIYEIDDLSSCLQPLIAKGVRVHVNCIGRSVLSKIVEGSAQNSLDILEQWFPGIRKHEFIFQRFSKKDFTALSLMRIEDILKSNLFLNNSLTSFSLGTAIVESIAPIVNDKFLVINEARIEFQDKQVKSIGQTHHDQTAAVTIGDDVIPASLILSYASAMSFFLPPTDLVVEGLPSLVSEAMDEFHAKRKIYQTGKVTIIALLVLLSINLMLNFWLDETLANMEAAVQFQEGLRKSNQQNRNTTQTLNAAYEKLGYKVNRLPLYYADQVAATLPSEIQLNKMEVGLLNEKILRKDRLHQFDITRIRIEGVSSDPTFVNAWIADLGNIPWVNSIHEQKYHFDARLGKGVFEFMVLTDP